MSRRAGLLVLLLLAGILSCVKKPRVAPVPLEAEGLNGAEVWRHIAVEGDFDTWPEWPDLGGIMPGQSPHGRYHQIYINPTLSEALPIADRKAPAGSVIVKRNFDAAKKPYGYTVMAKAPGYNPAAGDWFWAMYELDGKVKLEGKAAYCIQCHEGMKSNDYLIVHPLDMK